MIKKNEWQSIADDIEIEVESNTENQTKDIENKDTEKDDKAEYTWDRI